jgi:hypothetical protein
MCFFFLYSLFFPYSSSKPQRRQAVIKKHQQITTSSKKKSESFNQCLASLVVVVCHSLNYQLKDINLQCFYDLNFFFGRSRQLCNQGERDRDWIFIAKLNLFAVDFSLHLPHVRLRVEIN